ncbi:DNA primase [Sphingobium sp. MI1205]|uniref:DNA primase n=1 Tax=Sphingobium sp. MI1205 TaxID=407020 RepID=UPI0007706824|nr:DNA primase [Sphingobium sp. MI1205]AMK19345.1 P4 family phage/plasmid primase [Sphingobium sp. MI1205]
MSLPQSFLDSIRDRTSLSALIGASIKLEKAGREHKACCPFHGEKTASFTINDDKGFYHCFGCGAHGDAIRWLTDHAGMDFIDAVKELAAKAGIEMPARSPEDAQRERRRSETSDVMGSAAEWFQRQLHGESRALAQLEARGISTASIARFGLGYAPGQRSIGGSGIAPAQLVDAGLLIDTDDGFRDRFRGRLMVPIQDARGRVIAFGGRATRPGQEPKYVNSEGGSFDKGATLYNLHRAAPAARSARRLIIVEGYFDVIALDQAGIAEVVAPMGTAITPQQLERAWRVFERPVLLMDGDAAGRKAALRACERALPLVGPGRSLSIATLPDGSDPDDLVRSQGRAAIDALIDAAVPLADALWQGVLADADHATPEGRAAIWKRLAGMAGAIADEETRAQYLSDWRARFDVAFPPPPPWARDIETLPFGRLEALSEQPEPVQARLKAMAVAWFDGRIERLVDSKDAVLRLAFVAGRRVGAGLLAEVEVKEKLLVRLDALPDLQPADVERALGDGINRAWDIGPDLVTLGCVLHPMTDFGIGERLIARHGTAFRFTTAKGWLGWDDRRWRVLDQDKDGPPPSELQSAIFDTIRAIQAEARAVRQTGIHDPDSNPHGLDRLIPSGRKNVLLSALLAKFGRESETAGKPSSIAKLAQKWLTVSIEAFDCDPFAINVLNGTLRFERYRDSDGRRRARFSLEAHRREDLNTKLAPVAFDPDAICPIYDDFFAWAHPDGGMRRYLHQVVGYTATGDTGEQKLWFHYGLGANGKSTAMDLWAHVLGDYAGTIGIETFLDQGIKKRGDAASPDLARLGGVRLLRASEPERGAKLNEALIKAATGGEPMAVRALHRGFFDLLPLFKLHIGGNYKPSIPGTDEGIWRRMKLVPWNAHVADGERDEQLPLKLRAEAAGVLNHMVRGLLDWLANGLIEPDAVREATAQYREDSDPLARFLKLCTAQDQQGRVQSSRLYEVFQAWCKAAGEREWTPVGFSKAMLDKGFVKKTSNGVQWLGMRLVREVGDFVDEHGRVREVPIETPEEVRAPPAGPPPDADADWVPDF